MKILQITPGYFASALYKCLFSAIAAYEVDSTIIALINKNIDDTEEISNNLRIYQCKSTAKRVLFFPKQNENYRRINRDIPIESYQLIHAHMLFSAGYIAWRFKRSKKIPYIVAIRNTDVNVFFKYMFYLRKLGIAIMRDADKVVFISPAYKKKVIEEYVPKELKEEIECKSIVIPNGINSYFINNTYSKKEAPEGVLRLIYVGEVSKNKNIITTIKAAENLIKNGIDVELTIVGEIKYNKFRAILGEKSFIKYFEPCPKEEVLLHMREADIFVMPSFTETFGLVYAEAMSQGLPIIYTKGQGFDQQFQEGEVGYHVNPYSQQDIVEKILKILKDYKEISNRCTRNSILFDWNKIAGEYKELYIQSIK